jgi:hypothetical protein
VQGKRSWRQSFSEGDCHHTATGVANRTVISLGRSCDGDTWHIKPDAAAHDNARNNFMEQRGWHVPRFGTTQLTDDLPGCVRSVVTMINRCGGLILSDDSGKAIAETRPDGWKQGRLF